MIQMRKITDYRSLFYALVSRYISAGLSHPEAVEKALRTMLLSNMYAENFSQLCEIALSPASSNQDVFQPEEIL